MGLRVALSTKYAQDQLIVVDSLEEFHSHKTKDLKRILDNAYGENSTVLLLSSDINEKLEMAAGNLPRCGVLNIWEINVLSLLKFDKLIIEKSAIDML